MRRKRRRYGQPDTASVEAQRKSPERHLGLWARRQEKSRDVLLSHYHARLQRLVAQREHTTTDTANTLRKLASVESRPLGRRSHLVSTGDHACIQSGNGSRAVSQSGGIPSIPVKQAT